MGLEFVTKNAAAYLLSMDYKAIEHFTRQCLLTKKRVGKSLQYSIANIEQFIADREGRLIKMRHLQTFIGGIL